MPGEPLTKIVYEGNLIIESENITKDHQKFRLIKVVSDQIEKERIFVHLEFSTNINYMLISFAIPTLFFIPMWKVATPFDNGRNLLQLTGGSIKVF